MGYGNDMQLLGHAITKKKKKKIHTGGNRLAFRFLFSSLLQAGMWGSWVSHLQSCQRGQHPWELAEQKVRGKDPQITLWVKLLYLWGMATR